MERRTITQVIELYTMLDEDIGFKYTYTGRWVQVQSKGSLSWVGSVGLQERETMQEWT